MDNIVCKTDIRFTEVTTRWICLLYNKVNDRDLNTAKMIFSSLINTSVHLRRYGMVVNETASQQRLKAGCVNNQRLPSPLSKTNTVY